MGTDNSSNDWNIALALQASLDENLEMGTTDGKATSSDVKKHPADVSIVDEYWEYADPNPDIRELFVQFNDMFFDGLLAGCEVKWSSRMTLCAGMCAYEGYGGLCSVRLSQPLLKLRPRKDLVETLLHEMIHALLFVTENNRDHDGHGPQFKAHMRRINAKTGADITIYHNFHNEVREYRQHWWKCTGPCQYKPPFYGMVKRSMNRAPSPRDSWWYAHRQKCEGQFVKVKEPDGYKDKRKSGKKAGTEPVSQDDRPRPKVLKEKDRLGSIEHYFEKLPEGHRLGSSCSISTTSAAVPHHCEQKKKGDSDCDRQQATRDRDFRSETHHSMNSSSADKAVIIVDDIDSEQPDTSFGVVSPKRSSSHSTVSRDVSNSSCMCPVCSQEVSLNVINTHLDSCLASSNADYRDSCM